MRLERVMGLEYLLLDVCMVSTPSTSVNRTVPSLLPSVTWVINCIGLLLKPFSRNVLRTFFTFFCLLGFDDTDEEFESVASLPSLPPEEFFVSISAVAFSICDVFSLSLSWTRDEALIDLETYRIIQNAATMILIGKVTQVSYINSGLAKIIQVGVSTKRPKRGMKINLFVDAAILTMAARCEAGISCVLDERALLKSSFINQIVIPLTAAFMSVRIAVNMK